MTLTTRSPACEDMKQAASVASPPPPDILRIIRVVRTASLRAFNAQRSAAESHFAVSFVNTFDSSLCRTLDFGAELALKSSFSVAVSQKNAGLPRRSSSARIVCEIRNVLQAISG